MGFEPMNTGFADQRVSHFAIGALVRHAANIGPGKKSSTRGFSLVEPNSIYFGCATVRRYGFTVL
jgi:hypothetical protein